MNYDREINYMQKKIKKARMNLVYAQSHDNTPQEQIKNLVEKIKIHETILDALEIASHVRHGKWIPVKEQLPEFGERVLATDGCFVGEFYINSRGQWKRYNAIDHSLIMALDILWWMPMPEPPNCGAKMDGKDCE